MNIINTAAIYFFYGLAFFTMGVVAALKYKHQSKLKLANSLWLLAAFGILHGVHEWVQLFIMIQEPYNGPIPLSLSLVEGLMVAVSFLFLLQFGINLATSVLEKHMWARRVPVLVFSAWLLVFALYPSGSEDRILNGAIWGRYFLGFPGAALTGYALISYSSETKSFGMPNMPRNLLYAGTLFSIYSVLTGLIVPKAPYFPASVINYDSFVGAIGIPVQVLRGICAVAITYFIIKTLDIFNFETRKRIDNLLEVTQRSKNKLLLLQEVNNLLNAGASREEIFDAITEGFTSTLDYDSCALHLLDEDGAHLVCRSYSMDSKIYEKVEKLTGLSAVGYKIPLHEDSPLTKIIRTGEPFITDDVPALIASHTNKKHLKALAKPLAEVIRINHGIGVPLMAGDKAVGVIGIGSKRELSKKDADMLANFAKQAGLAVEKAGMEQKLRDYSRGLEQKVKERTRELERSQQQVVHSEKLAATGKLAAAMAHEINNPLSGIKNCIYLLKDKAEEDKTREYLEMADEELDRIAEIVRRLLDFYRPKTENRVPSNMNAIVEKILALVENQLTSSRISVHKRLDQELPEVVVSPEQFEQVFLNIMLNAQEAMPGGGELNIRTYAGNSSVQIEFADTGCGIPEESVEHIFDPFFSTKENGKGTGLGLSVGYGIVQAHNGRIDVRSEVGKGTIFTVAVPLEV